MNVCNVEAKVVYLLMDLWISLYKACVETYKSKAYDQIGNTEEDIHDTNDKRKHLRAKKKEEKKRRDVSSNYYQKKSSQP